VSGIFVALKLHPDDAQALFDYVAAAGITPLPPEHMHLTLVRCRAGNFDLSRVAKACPSLELDVAGPPQQFSMRDVRGASYLPLRSTREHWLVRGGLIDLVRESRKDQTPYLLSEQNPPHVTLTFAHSTQLREIPSPLRSIRFSGLQVQRSNKHWYRQFMPAVAA
jgi:2'-5' RNA ligase